MSEGVLSKSAILKGTAHIEEVYIDQLDGRVAIRPLSDGEWADFEAKMLTGQRVTGTNASAAREIEFDVGSTNHAFHKAKCWAVALAMSVNGEKWQPGEIASLPAGAPTAIFTEVKRLTQPSEKQVDEDGTVTPEGHDEDEFRV